jgi:hypothetical protein
VCLHPLCLFHYLECLLFTLEQVQVTFSLLFFYWNISLYYYYHYHHHHNHYYFGGTRNSLLLDRLSVTPHPFFALVIFQVGSHIFACGRPQTLMLLPAASHVVGTTGVYHHAQFEMGVLLTFLFGLPLNHGPPNLCLLSSWDYRFEPPHLTFVFKIWVNLICLEYSKNCCENCCEEIVALIFLCFSIAPLSFVLSSEKVLQGPSCFLYLQCDLQLQFLITS